MAGKAEQFMGLSIETRAKMYRDPAINAGTLGLVDVKHLWAGGGQDLPSGSELKNLCWTEDPAVVGSVSLNYDAAHGA